VFHLKSKSVNVETIKGIIRIYKRFYDSISSKCIPKREVGFNCPVLGYCTGRIRIYLNPSDDTTARCIRIDCQSYFRVPEVGICEHGISFSNECYNAQI